MENTFEEADMLEVMRGRIEKSSLRSVARKMEISPAYLSDVMRGRRAVSSTIADKLGFERIVETVIIYRKKK